MNLLQLAILLGRSLASQFGAEYPRKAAAVEALADALESGRDIDEGMQKVADLLNEREVTDADFDAVTDSIRAGTDQFLAP